MSKQEIKCGAIEWMADLLDEEKELSQIKRQTEDDCLKGAIDYHIHAYPDEKKRRHDMIEVAIEAAKAGMQCVCFKDHYIVSGGVAYLTQKHIDYLVKNGKIKNRVMVYGGVGLNWGIDSQAFDTALRYPCVKMVSFPTETSPEYLESIGKEPSKGIRLIDNGKVLPQVTAIIKKATKAKVGIGLGPTNFLEVSKVADKIAEVGGRAILEAPMGEVPRLTVDEIKQISQKGVLIGPQCQPKMFAKIIREVGSGSCVICNDFGQQSYYTTPDISMVHGTRLYIRALLRLGISKKSIETMIKVNPAHLLYMSE